MNVGCEHNPEAVCEQCNSIAGTTSEQSLPLMVDSGLSIPEPKTYTREELKAATKDETVPEVVRRHLKTILYGEGGNGRKGVQQSELARRNWLSATDGKEGSVPYRNGPGAVKGMSGRQLKRARKLMRQGAKAVRDPGRIDDPIAS